jgi:predicted chitinase
MVITTNQLISIMPHCPLEKAEEYSYYLELAMSDGEITTIPRAAAFVAQLAHESGELRWWVEQSGGMAYECRADLGNICPGDGPRFKGRGPIQITGRDNYRRASVALGVDLENNPELASRPDVGFRVAVWFWNTHGLNALADAGDFTTITRRINGGLNGTQQREAYYRRALVALSTKDIT